MSESLQEYNDESHQRFDQTELQGGLLAEPEEADRVGFAVEAASAVETAGTDRLAANLRHDVAFTSQILVAKGQEIVYDESCNTKLGQRGIRDVAAAFCPPS